MSFHAQTANLIITVLLAIAVASTISRFVHTFQIDRKIEYLRNLVENADTPEDFYDCTTILLEFHQEVVSREQFLAVMDILERLNVKIMKHLKKQSEEHHRVVKT